MREQFFFWACTGTIIRMPDWPPSAIAFRIEHLGSMIHQKLGTISEQLNVPIGIRKHPRL
jgi:hypothetical protein